MLQAIALRPGASSIVFQPVLLGAMAAPEPAVPASGTGWSIVDPAIASQPCSLRPRTDHRSVLGQLASSLVFTALEEGRANRAIRLKVDLAVGEALLEDC